jgi:hypothetical protein
MATSVAETCWWPTRSTITFINPKCICWSFNIFYSGLCRFQNVLMWREINQLHRHTVTARATVDFHWLRSPCCL